MASVPALTAPAVAFTPEQTQKWELGVSLILNFWQPLTDAVVCGWGGANSSEKRDWLCGAVADMWTNDPETDDFDVETTLMGVMEDEFEVNLEDDSAFDVGDSVRLDWKDSGLMGSRLLDRSCSCGRRSRREIMRQSRHCIRGG